MKIKINEGFLGLKDNYLFSEVARRVRDYGSANPEEEKRLIRLGIGDVTLPLAPCVVAAARHRGDGRKRNLSRVRARARIRFSP